MKWTDDENIYLIQNYGKIPTKNLVLNRSIKAIHDHANKLHLKGNMPLSKKIYTINEDYFAQPNIENCYWAGLLAADGYINGNLLSLDLTDRDLVEEFVKSIQYTGNICTIQKSGNRKLVYYVRIRNQKIVDDLYKHWNISTKKSFTLKPPNLIDLQHKLSYIIGCIDGDGWIFKNDRCQMVLGCCGTYDLMSWMGNLLNINVTANGNIHQIRCSGKPAIKLLEQLKQINTPYKLPRKWNLVKE